MRVSPTALGLVAASLACLGLGPAPQPSPLTRMRAVRQVGTTPTPKALALLLADLRRAAARGSDATGDVSAEVDGQGLSVTHHRTTTSGLVEARDDGAVFQLYAGDRLGRPSELSVALLLRRGVKGWALGAAEVRVRGAVYRAGAGTLEVTADRGGTLVGTFSLVATRVDAPSEKIEISGGRFRVTPDH